MNSLTWRSLAPALLALAGVAAHAAGDPERPIRLLVGFPPGGGADFVARHVAQALGPVLGANVVVENKPGANGTIAAAEVARAAADGHTLLLGVTASQSIGPALMAKPLYDPLKDFTAITQVGYTPLVLVVNPKLPARNVGEFVRMAGNGGGSGSLSYGSAGIGNITHMAAELFVQQSGATRLQHIPYKGSGPVITDLIGGHIAAYFDTLPSSLPFIRNGQLRALAVTNNDRAAAAPDIPTLRESGLPHYSATTWFGVLAPPRLAPELVERLHAALVKALGAADARQVLSQRGVEPVLDTPAQFQAVIEADLRRWREVTRKGGITTD